jgi:hypothetical protein|tara:strand:+ start:175 stop:318 length:144 start_codon:yes stop_codon:yes gene_type:complete
MSNDMRENINGFVYDLSDGGDICDICGEHYHNCGVHTEDEIKKGDAQ